MLLGQNVRVPLKPTMILWIADEPVGEGQGSEVGDGVLSDVVLLAAVDWAEANDANANARQVVRILYIDSRV